MTNDSLIQSLNELTENANKLTFWTNGGYQKNVFINNTEYILIIQTGLGLSHEPANITVSLRGKIDHKENPYVRSLLCGFSLNKTNDNKPPVAFIRSEPLLEIYNPTLCSNGKPEISSQQEFLKRIVEAQLAQAQFSIELTSVLPQLINTMIEIEPILVEAYKEQLKEESEQAFAKKEALRLLEKSCRLASESEVSGILSTLNETGSVTFDVISHETQQLASCTVTKTGETYSRTINGKERGITVSRMEKILKQARIKNCCAD